MKISGVHTSSNTSIVIEHSDGGTLQIPAGMYEERIRNFSRREGERDSIFDALDFVLKEFSGRDEDLLFELYLKVTRSGATKETLDDFEDTIEDAISLFLAKTDMINNLVYLCRDDGPIGAFYPALDHAGMLAHHDEDRTFFLSDYVRLTALSYLLKLLAPIFGKYSHVLKTLGVKEDDVAPMVLDLCHSIVKNSTICYTYYKFYTICFDVVDKKIAYHDRPNNRRAPIKSPELFKANKITIDDFEYLCLSYVMCKRLVTYHPTLNGEEIIPNIAVYIDDGIKRITDTRLSALKNRLSY